MMKKILAAAIVSAFAAPAFAATANVDVYGSIGMSVDMVDGGSTSTFTQLFADTELPIGMGYPITGGTYQSNSQRYHNLAEDRYSRSVAQTMANSKERRGRVSSNNSFIGFKGAEDLGGGLSAIWQLESSIAPDNGGLNTFGTRNSFVGLKSKAMGTLTAGIIDTPLKTSTGKLDVFANTMGDYRSMIGSMGSSVRPANSVLYVTPEFSGLTGRLLYGFGNESGSAVSTLNGGDNAEIWSLSATYDNGPMFATAAYEDNKGTGAAQDVLGGGNLSSGAQSATPTQLYGTGINSMFWIFPDSQSNSSNISAANGGYSFGDGPSSKSFDSRLKTWRLGAGYKFGGLRVGLAYENVDGEVTVRDNNNTTGLNAGVYSTTLAGTTDQGLDLTQQSGKSTAKRNIWYAGAAYTMGNATLKAAYARASDLKGSGPASAFGADTGANQWTLGADYSLSKRTTAYALYTTVRNDKNGTFSLAGGATGIDGVSPADVGENPTAFSMGMRHTF